VLPTLSTTLVISVVAPSTVPPTLSFATATTQRSPMASAVVEVVRTIDVPAVLLLVAPRVPLLANAT
jgi:hypothetical protein